MGYVLVLHFQRAFDLTFGLNKYEDVNFLKTVHRIYNFIFKIASLFFLSLLFYFFFFWKSIWA